MGKCPKDAEDVEDAEVGELCGSAPPHPVRCPEKGSHPVKILLKALLSLLGGSKPPKEIKVTNE